MADDSKTEQATPKKRRDERKKGNVYLSQDAVAVTSLLGSVAMLRLTFANAAVLIGRFMTECISLAGGGKLLASGAGALPSTVVPAVTLSKQLLMECISLLARVAGPFLAATVLLSIAATFAQTRLLVSFELIKPKFDKINPLQGFKRLFSLRSLIDAVKNLLKVIILLYLIYTSLRDLMGISQRYLYADLTGAGSHLFLAIFSMLIKICLAFIAVAGLDFLYQWWDYERQMRMSKQEVKEEYKQTEGDPQVKGRIKELQRRMAQSRMMQQVPQADVIIRNPTHIAVALRYHPGSDAAPVVLAKGLDHLAEQIIQVAEKHDIMVLENVPLAHALYAEAELYHAIPTDLYEAVAEIMVYLYRLGRIKQNAHMDEHIDIQ